MLCLENVWNAHNMDSLESYIDEDFRASSAVFPLPHAGARRSLVGIEAFRDALAYLFTVFPDWTVEMRDLVVEGNHAVYTSIRSGTQSGGEFAFA